MIGLEGKYQYDNAHLAKIVVQRLKPNLNSRLINEGLEKVVWYGRNQIVHKNPVIVFDVAHNASGIASFINFYNTIATGKKILIISLQKRKNIESQIDSIENIFDEIIICETKNKRSMEAEELTKQFNSIEKIKIILSDYNAIQYALKKATSKDSIGIIGTHHLGESISKIFNISFNLL